MADRPTTPTVEPKRIVPSRLSHSLIALLACGLASCPLFPDPEPLPTIPGPERPELKASLSGTVLHHTYGRSVHATDLATGNSRSWELDGRVYALDGPDVHGRCVSAVQVGGVVRLVLHDLRTNETTSLVEHRGSEPYWEQSAFLDLTLSGDGEFIAFRRLRDGRTFEERERPDSGFIEIRTSNGEFVKRFDAGGFSAGLDWRPGRRQLAFGQSMELDELPEDIAPKDSGFDRRTVAFLYDLEDDSRRPLCVGSVLGFTPDGETLVLQDDEDSWSRFDLGTNDRTPLDAPGLLEVHAVLEDGLFLYAGSPTEGAESGVLRTLQKSPQAMWTLKVADPRSGAFVTVLPEVGRFHAFAIGASL